MNASRHYRASCSGQAMIELMLGMLLILILLVGVVQFVAVADAHSCLDSRIRGNYDDMGGSYGCGVRAMQPLSPLTECTPLYITTWSNGPDGQRFTADDTRKTKSPDTLQLIAEKSVKVPTDWNQFAKLAHPSSLGALHGLSATNQDITALGFIGLRYDVTLPVSAFAQDLFYNKPDVVVQEDCWRPIMNGLY
jgi:hypothetical protein